MKTKFLLLAFCLSFCLYLPTVTYEYVLDDHRLIEQNQTIKQGISGLKTLWFQHFWENTLLGNTIPFSLISYVDPRNPEIRFNSWQPGMTPIYEKEIKYPTEGNGPFRYVYGSPSFVNEDRILIGIFIYEINDDYIPQT